MPHFKRMKIKKFLSEFELLAKGATIMDEEKCEYVVSYCKEKEAKFIRTLSGYGQGVWYSLEMSS